MLANQKTERGGRGRGGGGGVDPNPPLPLLPHSPLSSPKRSQHTPLHTVKAVIIGQDPYHGINQAHGLAFSVRPPTRAPPSLKNMYIALKNDYPNFQPPPQNGGLLTPWADRGVLMLNTCLTVESAKANSHANHGWEKFTQKVIDTVAKTRTRGVVFLAWGNPAGQRVAKVNRSVHCVLQSVHPSPLSAARGFVSFILFIFFEFFLLYRPFSPFLWTHSLTLSASPFRFHQSLPFCSAFSPPQNPQPNQPLPIIVHMRPLQKDKRMAQRTLRRRRRDRLEPEHFPF